MENYTFGWGVTIILILGLFALIYFGAKWVAAIGYNNAKLAKWYEDKYAIIDGIISDPDMCVCEANFDWIVKWLDELKSLPYKNPEMTSVLENKFMIKFESIIEKRKNEAI